MDSLCSAFDVSRVDTSGRRLHDDCPGHMRMQGKTIAAGVPTSLGIIDEAVAAEQKRFIFLQISDSYMGFDKPANPNVDYLAAIQAVFAVYHRRVSCNEFAFTETRLIMTTVYSRAH